MADLIKEVEPEKEWWSPESPDSADQLFTVDMDYMDYIDTCRRATPSSPFQAKPSDMKDFITQYHHNPSVLRTDMVNEDKIQKGIAESIDIKVEHKDIVEGEVQKEMNDQMTTNPYLSWLSQLLESFKEVFSALPPPVTVPKVVTMELKLKEEYKDQGLRSKFFPMPKADSDEIEAHVNELIKANLVEE
jgi:hypothetical protein